MTLEEFDAARQLLAEETLGRVLREVQAEEDRAFAASARAIGG
jgi:hypothetical protein